MGWTLLPLIQKFARRAFKCPSIHDVADRTWDIYPADTHLARQAVFLPGQLEKVTGWMFSPEDPRWEMAGGWEHRNPPTQAFLLRDAVLVEGSLYKGLARDFLHTCRRRPRFRIDAEFDRGAIYSSFNGHKWFANWLVDDCVAYPLAVEQGVPVTTEQVLSDHMYEYERHFGMAPRCVRSVRFREVVIFNDASQNLDRKRRFNSLRARLMSKFPAVASNPGVFILRGASGEQRLLENEIELAHHLRDTRGFTIVAPEEEAFSDVAAKCSGAEIVVGFEGSHLFNGIIFLADAGAVVAIQPEDRFVTMIKHLLDREQKTFGFVVASKTESGYVCDRDELDRTLDMLPSKPS